MLKICEECGEEIKSKRANQYCGTVCRNRGIAKKRRSYKLEDSPTWKGGRKLDSCGYVLVKHPKSRRKDGYIQEHRLIMEEFLGRELEEDEDVHHINGDKQDNRIENLSVIKRSEHMRLHALENHMKRKRDSYGRFA